MWSAIVSGGLFILAIIFSLAKASARADNITESHREELLARKKNVITHQNTHPKKQMKG